MSVVETGKRDPVHLLWCAVLLMLIFSEWVAMWKLNANETWSAAEFFSAMTSPVLFYAASHLLATDHPDQVHSWTTRLDSIARPFLIILALISLNFYLRNFAILGEANPTGVPWIMSLIVATALLVGIFAPTRRNLTIIALMWMLPSMEVFVRSGLA